MVRPINKADIADLQKKVTDNMGHVKKVKAKYEKLLSQKGKFKGSRPVKFVLRGCEKLEKLYARFKVFCEGKKAKEAREGKNKELTTELTTLLNNFRSLNLGRDLSMKSFNKDLEKDLLDLTENAAKKKKDAIEKKDALTKKNEGSIKNEEFKKEIEELDGEIKEFGKMQEEILNIKENLTKDFNSIRGEVKTSLEGLVGILNNLEPVGKEERTETHKLAYSIFQELFRDLEGLSDIEIEKKKERKEKM